MNCNLSVSFDSPYQADRALARLRSGGIRLKKVAGGIPQPKLERTLFVAYPYGRSFHGTTDQTANSIPYTTGNTLIMPTPFFTRQAEGTVRLKLQLDVSQLSRAKGILINNGGRELRSLPQ